MNYADMSDADLRKYMSQCEEKIGALGPKRRAVRDEMLELNTERDKAKAAIDIRKLRANHPELKIEPR